MKKFNQRGYFYFIAFMLMATTFLPVVFNNLPPIIRSHHVWTALWVFSLIVFYPRIFRSKIILMVLFYAILMLNIYFNDSLVNIGEWNKNQLIDEFYSIAIGLSVITYFRLEGDFFRLAKLVRWTLLFVFITAMMTIVTALIEPLYVRSMTGLSAIVVQSEVDYILSYKKYGGGSYGFAGALLCLFPILIYYFKNNFISIIKRKYLVVFVGVIFFALLGTQIFANILLSIFIIIFSQMGSKHTNRIIFLSSLLIIALTFVPSQVYSNLLINISLIFPKDSEIFYKLNDLSKFITFGDYVETGIFYRAERYPLLIQSFIANPFLGHFYSGLSNDILLGAHVHWMYKLGAYGLLGSLPLFYIIYTFIKGSLKYFEIEFVFPFLVAVLSIVALGLMKALSGREMWYMFFVIAPGLYYLPLLKKANKSNYNKYDKGNNIDKIKT